MRAEKDIGSVFLNVTVQLVKQTCIQIMNVLYDKIMEVGIR